MISQSVASGGARLAVSVWGDGEQAIIALHPGVADSRVWRWCAPVWADSGSRVIAYDRRGFGETSCEAELHDDMDDLLAVIQATGASPAVLVGNSKGGGLALNLALSFPDHITAMVLLAPSVTGYDPDGWPTSPAEAAQDDLIAAAEVSGDLDLVNRLEVRYWLDGVDQPEGRVAGQARDLLLEMNDLALRTKPIGEAAPAPPAWNRLSEIRIPVLVVAGAYDLPGIKKQCEEIADAIPGGRLTTIAESAHCPSLDRPDELNTVVLDFIDATRREQGDTR